MYIRVGFSGPFSCIYSQPSVCVFYRCAPYHANISIRFAREQHWCASQLRTGVAEKGGKKRKRWNICLKMILLQKMFRFDLTFKPPFFSVPVTLFYDRAGRVFLCRFMLCTTPRGSPQWIARSVSIIVAACFGMWMARDIFPFHYKCSLICSKRIDVFMFY